MNVHVCFTQSLLDLLICVNHLLISYTRDDDHVNEIEDHVDNITLPHLRHYNMTLDPTLGEETLQTLCFPSN